MLDLDGDGIETTKVENGIYFDKDVNGFAELSSWVAEDDGILVLDRNQNGTIDNGTELFGDYTPLSAGGTASNGYEALADLDSNGDGVINASDSEFANLKVLTGTGEVYTLSELGIESLNLSYTNENTVDGSGNTLARLGSYTKVGGEVLNMGEYLLNSDITDTIETEWLEVPAEIQALPDVRGFGKVYSLHQAMVRDTSEELQTLIESFINETDAGVRGAMSDIILFTWTGNNNVIMFDKYYTKIAA